MAKNRAGGDLVTRLQQLYSDDQSCSELLLATVISAVCREGVHRENPS